MTIASIAALQEHVETAGAMALAAQRRMRAAERTLKRDGSVVTETDKQIDEYLFEQIAALHPQANVLTEETVREFDPDKAHTFAVDSIAETSPHSASTRRSRPPSLSGDSSARQTACSTRSTASASSSSRTTRSLECASIA
jgi:hypothetical protein